MNLDQMPLCTTSVLLKQFQAAKFGDEELFDLAKAVDRLRWQIEAEIAVVNPERHRAEDECESFATLLDGVLRWELQRVPTLAIDADLETLTLLQSAFDHRLAVISKMRCESFTQRGHYEIET